MKYVLICILALFLNFALGAVIVFIINRIDNAKIMESLAVVDIIEAVNKSDIKE